MNNKASIRQTQILSFLKSKYGISSLGEANYKKREMIIRDTFSLMNRIIDEGWVYKNSHSKIPFIFKLDNPNDWNQTRAEQSWDKFVVGKEVQYFGLTKENRIKLIRNVLKNSYQYALDDKLEEEIEVSKTIKKQKISLYCASHGWNDPINLSSILQKTAKGTCTLCLKHDVHEAQRVDFERIVKEWNLLERTVSEGQIYVNNRTPIRFYSKCYQWFAEQSWDSYQLHKEKAKHSLTEEEYLSYDPHDERSLVDKPNYLKKILDDFNKVNKKAFKLDPAWEIPSNIGKRNELHILDPQWKNHLVLTPWQTLIDQKKYPNFKSIADKSKYIREVFEESGRNILLDWSYSGDAHQVIPFTSKRPCHEGMIFANSWNHVSNGLGFSIQAMINKSTYYGSIVEDLDYRLITPIDDGSAMSQMVSIECDAFHASTKSLYSFAIAPESFCHICSNHKPDSLKVLINDKERRNQKTYIYYCLLQDIRSRSAKKIGITKHKNPKHRLGASFFIKDLAADHCFPMLNRAEACAVERKLLIETGDWYYEDDFDISESRAAKFPGHTELRDITLPDIHVHHLLRKNLEIIKSIGWISFWESYLPCSNKERKLIKDFRDRELSS